MSVPLPYYVTNGSEDAVDVWNISQETIDAIIEADIPIGRHPAGFYRIGFNSLNAIRDHYAFFTARKTGRVFCLITRDDSGSYYHQERIDGYWLKLLPNIPLEEIRHSRDAKPW